MAKKKVVKKKRTTPRGNSTTGQVYVLVGVTPPGPKQYSGNKYELGIESALEGSLEDTATALTKQLCRIMEQNASRVFETTDGVSRKVERSRR